MTVINCVNLIHFFFSSFSQSYEKLSRVLRFYCETSSPWPATNSLSNLAKQMIKIVQQQIIYSQQCFLCKFI